MTPTLAPAAAPASVVGQLVMSGVDANVADDYEDVWKAAIANVAGVEAEAVTILSYHQSQRRRLQSGVVVAYEIASEDAANRSLAQPLTSFS